jgi:hypothetical protein
MKGLKKDLNKLRGKNPKMRLEDDEDGDAPLAINQYGADPFSAQYQQSSSGSPMAARRNPPVKKPAESGGDGYAGGYAGGVSAGAGGVDPEAASRARLEAEQREQEELELAMAISASMEEEASRRARPPPRPPAAGLAAGLEDEEAQLRRALELSRLEAEPDLMGGGDEPQAAPAAGHDDLLSSPAPPPAPSNPLNDLDALFAAGAPAAPPLPQTGQRLPAGGQQHYGMQPLYGMPQPQQQFSYGVQPQQSQYGMQPQQSQYGMQPQQSQYGMQPQQSQYGMQPQHQGMLQQPMGAMPIGGQMGMAQRPPMSMDQPGMMGGYGGMGGGGMGGMNQPMNQPMMHQQPSVHPQMVGGGTPAASPFAAPPSNFMAAPLPSADPFGMAPMTAPAAQPDPFGMVNPFVAAGR